MRIAHVSDLHLLSLDGVRWLSFMNKRWTGGLNLLFSRGRHYQAAVFEAMVADINAAGVDHVVCTGDITNLSFAAEFRFARALFDRFALGPAHVTCIPGNHDTYVADVAGAFEREMAPYCAGDDGFAWDDEGAPGAAAWPLVRVRGDVAIIGVSTSRASGWFMAHGELGGRQLSRLEARLADARLAGKFRLLLIHHPPAGKRARHPVRGLRDHGALQQVLARTGCELVLHGHEHLDLAERLGGPDGGVIPVRGIQSGSYDAGAGGNEARRARYRVYEVQGGRVVGEEVRVWRGGKWGAET